MRWMKYSGLGSQATVAHRQAQMGESPDVTALRLDNSTNFVVIFECSQYFRRVGRGELVVGVYTVPCKFRFGMRGRGIDRRI